MLSESSLLVNVAVFVIAALVIGWTGTRLASLSDQLADRTGLGEAFTGTLFLGMTTSLPGLAASIFAAMEGRPALAISNAIGGIALQTTFLAFADIAHRKANLEHAAASVQNMIQATILAILLTLVLLGFTSPDTTIGHVHPLTPVLFIVAGAGYWMIYVSRDNPMWTPTHTSATVEDVPDNAQTAESLTKLSIKFGISALLITAAGIAVAHTTGNIADKTGMSESLAGALLSGFATSLPELVTTIAAVRRGALTLAVSDIIGGNGFDVLFVAVADLAYVQGSLFHAGDVGQSEIFLTGLAILLNLILLLGLLYRQRAGPGNIGFESALVLILYVTGFAILWLAM